MYIPPTKKNKIIALIAGCALVVLVVGTLVMRMNAKDATGFASEYGVVLREYDGTEIRLSHFRYSHIVVMVWATWCPYCSDQINDLIELKKQYGDRFEVIAVNRAEPLAVAKAYTDAIPDGDRIHFLLDPEDALYHSQGGYAMPETIFVGIDGKVSAHQRGPITKEEIVQKIEELLKD